MKRVSQFAERLCISFALLVLLGGTDAPQRVDDGLIKRVLAGLEWLAEHGPTPTERANTGDYSISQLAGARLENLGPSTRTFANALQQFGYGAGGLAIPQWVEELTVLEGQLLIFGRGEPTRGLAEIEADIIRLPTVPLDDRDRVIRATLTEEIAAAALGRDERLAIEAALARIEAVRRVLGVLR